MCGTVHVSGWHFRPGFGGDGHGIVVKLCRALGGRFPVGCVVVRRERTGNVAANRASQDHGRGAEAGGQATEAGGNATKARSGGKHSCIPPGVASHSNAGACERFSNGEVCRD
jgi:hypothetical protein